MRREDDAGGAFFLTGDGEAEEVTDKPPPATAAAATTTSSSSSEKNGDYSALDDLPVDFFEQQQRYEQQQALQQEGMAPTSPRLLARLKLDPAAMGQTGARSANVLYLRQPTPGEAVEIGFLARGGQPQRVVARIEDADETTLYLLAMDKQSVKVSEWSGREWGSGGTRVRVKWVAE